MDKREVTDALRLVLSAFRTPLVPMNFMKTLIGLFDAHIELFCCLVVVGVDDTADDETHDLARLAGEFLKINWCGYVVEGSEDRGRVDFGRGSGSGKCESTISFGGVGVAKVRAVFAELYQGQVIIKHPLWPQRMLELGADKAWIEKMRMIAGVIEASAVA